jgi:ketosteroid isomerase-like protein
MTIVSLDDRRAIDDLFVGFCYAADALGNGETLAVHFTEDAVYDLTGFGLREYVGRPAIRDFFQASFAATERNAHFLSNIKVHSATDVVAAASAYVHAFSHSSDGSKMEIRARYDVELCKTDDGWKFSRMGITVLPV